jgi:hypothetical protein
VAEKNKKSVIFHVEIPPTHIPWCAAKGVTRGILILQGGIYKKNKLYGDITKLAYTTGG